MWKAVIRLPLTSVRAELPKDKRWNPALGFYQSADAQR